MLSQKLDPLETDQYKKSNMEVLGYSLHNPVCPLIKKL